MHVAAIGALLIATLAPGGSFVDDDGNIHEGGIEAVAAQGITLGCNPPANDRFCPEDPVTRGQMAAFLARARPMATAGADSFIDDDGHLFEDAIDRVASAGITLGCDPPVNDRFCPDDRVTRGQMAAFMSRAQGLSATNRDYFDDDEGSVFESAINRLRNAGITQGCNPPGNDRFCPDRNITRGEMAAFLVRAFDLPSYDGPDRFRDDNGNVFEGAIERLAQAGITVGCNPPTNDRFCPNDYVTRGQMAAFLKRALSNASAAGVSSVLVARTETPTPALSLAGRNVEPVARHEEKAAGTFWCSMVS